VEQRVRNSAIITCLVSQHKGSKTGTNQGPETKYPAIFYYLFTGANSHDKFFMTKETDMPV